ncbi:MAG TPA: fumarylacetoacetate hydrolase family protein [bacterium]|nr:fumarylacetoacetate hydrolase family protein [bacterium]
MRLMSFEHDGHAAYGAVTDGGVVDLHRRVGQRWPTLCDALRAEALDELRQTAAGQPADYPLEAVSFLPVIPNPGKIFGIGMNYAEKQKEWAHTKDTPNLFIRFADSQVGHNHPVLKPRVSDHLDFEGELAVIIGKAGRHIPEAQALQHVAGYAPYLDGSVRDWQQHSTCTGKNFPSTGGFGPWMATGDEIPDPGRMTLTTRLNGQVMQHATTDQLIFTVPFLIAYLSTFTPLSPGDVIATGSPAGVGAKRTPPLWMKPGDVIEVQIDPIGTLRHPIAAEV